MILAISARWYSSHSSPKRHVRNFAARSLLGSLALQLAVQRLRSWALGLGGPLGDIDPHLLSKVPFKSATRRVQKGPL